MPSVPKLFSFYHEDAPELENSPLSRIVIDDGRSYLKRSPEQYDLILLTRRLQPGLLPSSLLFSKEFYAIAKPHLRPGGILQQWIREETPPPSRRLHAPCKTPFPYVRAFHSFIGGGVPLLGQYDSDPRDVGCAIKRTHPR